MKINAAQRLLVTAEGEWWDSLTDDMREQYLNEHPDSEYAKGYAHRKDPQKPGTGPAQPDTQQPPATVYGPSDKGTQQALRNLPKPVQKFVDSGGTKKGSKERKKAAEAIKPQNFKLARGILKDTVGAASGINSVHNMLNGKPKPGDGKKVASFIGNILGASVTIAALGAGGPVGLLTFMAIKHLAAPALYKMAQKALTKPPPATDSGDGDYGYWKDKNTWVSIPKKEWESLTDKEVNDYQDKGIDKGGKFKALEDKHGTRPVHSSAADANADEELMKHLLDGICEYAESGDIPDDAWKAAIAELNGQQDSQPEE